MIRLVGRRGQTSLPALAVALLLVVTATGLAFVFAEGVIASGDRQPRERRAAVALSERLVSPDSALTERANVLDGTRVDALDASTLRSRHPVVDGYDVAIRLNGTRIASLGSPSGGTTIRRIVLVERVTTRTLEPAFDGRTAATLPRRVETVRLAITPPAGTTIWRVRANNRTVLSNTSGLVGTFDVRLSRYETTTLYFSASGPLDGDTVDIEYSPTRTRKATLAVTVDDR
ncbi:MAG: hypothetical protein ABEH35_05600 [Haloarculaceae archaeon]